VDDKGQGDDFDELVIFVNYLNCIWRLNRFKLVII